MDLTERLKRAGFSDYEIYDGFAFLPLRGSDSLLDRIRRGLTRAGVYDDDLDFMAEEIVRSIGEQDS